MSSQTNVYPANKLNLWPLLILALAIFIPMTSYSASDWQELTPGIEYQDLEGGLLIHGLIFMYFVSILIKIRWHW